MTEATLGDTCKLYVDLPPEQPAVIAGDWVATEAGSRYLVLSSRLGRSSKHAQRNRWHLQVARLPKHTEPPEDVRVIWLRWYSRKRRA